MQGSCNSCVGPRLCVRGPCCVEHTVVLSMALRSRGTPRVLGEHHYTGTGCRGAGNPLVHPGVVQEGPGSVLHTCWGCQCARTGVRGSCKRACGCVSGAGEAAELGWTPGCRASSVTRGRGTEGLEPTRELWGYCSSPVGAAVCQGWGAGERCRGLGRPEGTGGL